MKRLFAAHFKKTFILKLLIQSETKHLGGVTIQSKVKKDKSLHKLLNLLKLITKANRELKKIR